MRLEDFHIYKTPDDLPAGLQAFCQPVADTGMHVFHHRYCVSLFPLAFPVSIEDLLDLRRNKAFEVLDQHDEHHYLTMIERPYRLDALLELAMDGAFEAKPQAYWECLRFCWVDSEIDEEDPVWSQVIDVDIPGRESFMSAKDRTTLNELPDFVRVWRGIQGDDSGEARRACHNGHSWTTDTAVAEKFAFRLARGTGSWLASTSIPKDRIFAYLGHRGESEIIIRPVDLVGLDIRITHASRPAIPQHTTFKEFANDGRDPEGP